MGFVPLAALEFVPRMLEALARQLPDVSFHPAEMMSYEIIEALRSGELDFGLTRAPATDGAIASVPVVKEQMILATPADHPLTGADEVRLEDLSNITMIEYDSDRCGFLQQVHDTLFPPSAFSP